MNHAVDFRSAFQFLVVYSGFKLAEGDDLVMSGQFGAGMPQGALMTQEICTVQAPGYRNFPTVVITGFAQQ